MKDWLSRNGDIKDVTRGKNHKGQEVDKDSEEDLFAQWWAGNIITRGCAPFFIISVKGYEKHNECEFAVFWRKTTGIRLKSLIDVGPSVVFLSQHFGAMNTKEDYLSLPFLFPFPTIVPQPTDNRHRAVSEGTIAGT